VRGWCNSIGSGGRTFNQTNGSTRALRPGSRRNRRTKEWIDGYSGMTQIAVGGSRTDLAEPPQQAAERTGARRRSLTAYGLLAPSLFGVTIFLGIPVVLVVIFSLLKWNLLTPPKFVGLANYLDVFQHEGAGHALLVTFYYFLLNIPFQTAFALLMALLMNRAGRFTAIIRVACVLPYLATPVAMGVVW